jgi:RNA-directed DNA polymerase
MVATLKTGVKGGRWFSVIDKVCKTENLEASYRKVHRNKGKPGIDHVTTKAFGEKLTENLAKLQEQLRDGTYRPSALKRVMIPKPGSNEMRPLSIPTVRDRVVQCAVKHAIEPIFESTFAECSYGFRPGRGCKDALQEVDSALRAGYHYVVDCDIRKYFDTIPHDRLMTKVSQLISDGKVLDLLRQMLQQGVMTTEGEWTPEQGTPQGGVISPLLANIYLNDLDQELLGTEAKPTRYADDLVILCRSQNEAECILARVREWMTENGLELHPTKTCIVNMGKPGNSFDFLGYTFIHREKNGTSRLVRIPRKKSLHRFRDTIRGLTPRMSGVRMEHTIKRINSVSRGWFAYFQQCVSPVFDEVDGFIRRRLRAILLKRNRCPAFGNRHAHVLWPNPYFAAHGLFSMTQAHAAVRNSARR